MGGGGIMGRGGGKGGRESHHKKVLSVPPSYFSIIVCRKPKERSHHGNITLALSSLHLLVWSWLFGFIDRVRRLLSYHLKCQLKLVDRFYTVLFSAFRQTHCAFVLRDSEANMVLNVHRNHTAY